MIFSCFHSLNNCQQGWCDSPGTVSEVRAQLHNRQRGAIKRERTIAYSQFQQVILFIEKGYCLLLLMNRVWISLFSCFQRLRPSASPYARTNHTVKPLKHEKQGKNNSELSWLDRWMAAKPWENRLMEGITPEMTPFSRKSEDNSSSSGQDSVEVRRNNITTRISARPLVENQLAQSTSAPSSESLYDETSASTSSSASPSLMFSNSVKLEKTEETNMRKPSYMNLTESIKAKQRVSKFSSPNMQRYLTEEFPFNNKSMAFSNGDNRSCAGSNPSVNFSKELYPPMSACRFDGVRSRRQ